MQLMKTLIINAPIEFARKQTTEKRITETNVSFLSLNFLHIGLTLIVPDKEDTFNQNQLLWVAFPEPGNRRVTQTQTATQFSILTECQGTKRFIFDQL